VKVWDAQTGQELLSLQGLTGSVSGVAYSPDGKRLATSSGREPSYSTGTDREVKVWDAQTGQVVLSLKRQAVSGPRSSGAGSVAFSPDGKRLASGSGYHLKPGEVQVWDAETGQELLSLKGGDGSVAFSPDGKRLTSAWKVWDAQTGDELLTIKGATNGVFSPDGKRLASGAPDDPVKIWDATPLPEKP
jgi:WD40 repeat protein